MQEDLERKIILTKDTSSRDNMLVLGIVFMFIVFISNILTYHIVTTHTRKSVAALEKKMKVETKNLFANQINSSRAELVKNWEDTNFALEILERKYYSLESLLTSAERRDAVITIVK